MLESSKKTDVEKKENLELCEGFMLDLEQAECPVVHHFGPGIYIREVHLPAGIFAIGHEQRFDHLNIMLQGSVVMNDNGNLKTLTAPLIFTGKPGRKVGYILEDTIWQNVYATDETDVDKLESMFLNKSDTWKDYEDQLDEFRKAEREGDREDFLNMLSEYGFTVKQAREQSENEDDQMEMPADMGQKITIRDSYIEGKGVFLSHPAERLEIIAPARIDGKRTPAGRYTNHSKNPNAKFMKLENGNIYLVADRKINGCIGGDKGEEVTVDYRQALMLSGIFPGEMS